MLKLISCLVLSTLVVGSTGWAQEEVGGVTQRPVSEVQPKVLDSALNISGRVGALGYRDGRSEYTSRIIEGITLNWNVPKSTMFDRSNFVAGLESGLLFSHTGSSGATFFGSNSDSVSGQAGSNLFMIPMNLVAGYRPTDNTMISLYGGASAIYRSNSSAMMFGRMSDASGSGSSTEFFPDVGLNAGWELGQSVALSLRGDAIPTPSAVMFTATLGATFPLV